MFSVKPELAEIFLNQNELIYFDLCSNELFQMFLNGNFLTSESIFLNCDIFSRRAILKDLSANRISILNYWLSFIISKLSHLSYYIETIEKGAFLKLNNLLLLDLSYNLIRKGSPLSADSFKGLILSDEFKPESQFHRANLSRSF
jgi:hypothetical protein